MAINLAIRWPFELKILEKTHDMYLGIIMIIIIQSLKKGRKI